MYAPCSLAPLLSPFCFSRDDSGAPTLRTVRSLPRNESPAVARETPWYSFRLYWILGPFQLRARDPQKGPRRRERKGEKVGKHAAEWIEGGEKGSLSLSLLVGGEQLVRN